MQRKKSMTLSLIVLSLSLCCACAQTQTPAASGSSESSEPAKTTQDDASKTAPAAPASGTEWPASLVGDLPKPDFATVKYDVGKKGSISEGSIMIDIKGMKDGDKYIESLKGLGYSSQTNMKVGDATEFIGMKDDKSASVQVTYNPKTSECSIIYGH